MTEEILIAVFCETDDFATAFKRHCEEHYISEDGNTKGFFPRSSLCLSEIMTISIMFHLSSFRNFKHYYIGYVVPYWSSYFHKLPSYNRFVELMQICAVPLVLYMMKERLGKCTGISFIDSTTIKVCDNHRICSHKVFAGIAKRGKSSMGWFYGFKLHLTINDKGEILSFCLTPGNVDDRNEKVMEALSKDLFGKLFGDKGYISAKLFQELYERGITLITKAKKNAKKNILLKYEDKLLLRKRAIIESVNDFLKNRCQIEHSRHRSPINFLVNLLAGLVAYSFLPSLPSLNIIRDNIVSL